MPPSGTFVPGGGVGAPGRSLASNAMTSRKFAAPETLRWAAWGPANEPGGVGGTTGPRHMVRLFPLAAAISICRAGAPLTVTAVFEAMYTIGSEVEPSFVTTSPGVESFAILTRLVGMMGGADSEPI